MNHAGADDDSGAGVAPGDEELEQPSTHEELQRLCELMAQQQAHLTQLLESRQTTGQDDRETGLLDMILRNDEAGALAMVRSLRSDVLASVQDLAGMTALHWAVRVGSLSLVFAILEKTPQLADRPTTVGRSPPHWTALMVMADQSYRPHHRQMAAALVSHMSQTALSVRAGTLSTVSHLAAARGHIHLLKKVLWRLNDMGGHQAVSEHLAIVNSVASWLTSTRGNLAW